MKKTAEIHQFPELKKDETYQELKGVVSGPEYLKITKPEKPQPFNPYF